MKNELVDVKLVAAGDRLIRRYEAQCKARLTRTQIVIESSQITTELRPRQRIHIAKGLRFSRRNGFAIPEHYFGWYVTKEELARINGAASE